jgi:hypothetical protein
MGRDGTGREMTGDRIGQGRNEKQKKKLVEYNVIKQTDIFSFKKYRIIMVKIFEDVRVLR